VPPSSNSDLLKTLDLGSAIVTRKGPLVLLFYDGFEWRLQRGLLGGLQAQARRLARFVYRSARRKQVRTGFYTAFLSLRKSLELIGCDVRVNDYETAARHPDYPIGVAGYPSVIDKAPQPNPIIFGPGDFGLPEESAAVAQNPQYRKLIQPSDWFCEIYRPYCGDKLMTWFAGIDVDSWPDRSHDTKEIDCLIYDKIRWDRDRLVPSLLEPTQEMLKRRGRSMVTLRYGHHAHFDFARELARARSMIFLCEHETQGLAYQEAMSANVPVFAWDEGRLADPWLARFVTPATNVSSVPYFSDECGMTFKAADRDVRFDAFWSNLESYRPRDYVERELSMPVAGIAYLRAYLSLAPAKA
jgi:hypothetical protein